MTSKIKNSIVLTLICALLLSTVFVFSSQAVSVKTKKGTYFGGEDNVRMLVVKKATKNKITFVYAYVGWQESFSNTITVKLNKKNIGSFTWKDPAWNSSGKGTIKVKSKKVIKIKTTGKGYISTDGKWRTLKWKKSSTKI